MEEEDKEKSAEKGEKKHKKRQKKILADLKQQIEFYFSEPNLQKDLFLQQRMLEHPQGYVEIATIASFSRMMQLCDDVALVVKAMKMCPSVEVIDDQWVKPSKPLSCDPKNVDSVTVYVEKLPINADHDWVKSIFSSCGKVVYVSIPRYKSTRDIKGFAFVEFENECEAKQALEMFDQEKKSVKEELSGNDGDEEKNVEEPREKQGKKNKKRKQKLSESENEDGKTKGRKLKHKREEEKNALISDLSDNSSTTLKKRKRSMNKEASDEKESRIKFKKIGETRSELSESENDSVTGVKRKREINEENESDAISIKKEKNISESDDKDQLMPVDNNAEKKHKKRKRKRKEKKETEIPNLKVISKIEWLRLKQEYQKLQREAMTETKMNLKKNQEPLMQTGTPCKENPAFPEDGIKMEVQADKGELQGVHAKLPVVKLEMQPGVVLKYFTKEANDQQNLRDIFSAIAPVSYLEKQLDQEMGFVRFRTKEGCQKVLEEVTNGSLETIRVEELTEQEDAEYWEKLNKDRLELLQQQKQRKKQRGMQKIADKIEAQSKKRDHVHFDE